MATNLVKGQTIDLRNNDNDENFDLSSVTVGLGWDIHRKTNTSLLGKLFGGEKEEAFNLDAVAFLLDNNGKVANLGKTVQMSNGSKVGLHEGDVIFFNNTRHPSGHIWLNDERQSNKGDRQQIVVKLDSLAPQYDKLLFLVSVYQGRQRSQHFGAVESAYIRATDSNGYEIARFNLSANEDYNGMCSMIFAEVYRKDNSWKFHTLGNPHATDNFIEILKQYVYTQQ